jgi:hypothetical protein
MRDASLHYFKVYSVFFFPIPQGGLANQGLELGDAG